MSFELWLFAIKKLGQTMDVAKLIYDNMIEEAKAELRKEYDDYIKNAGNDSSEAHVFNGDESHCPYCNSELSSGVLHQEGYPIRWVPIDHGLGRPAPDAKGIAISEVMYGMDSMEGRYCKKCQCIFLKVSKKLE